MASLKSSTSWLSWHFVSSSARTWRNIKEHPTSMMGGHLEDGVCIEDGGEGLVNLVLDLCCPVNDDDKDDDGDDDDGDDKADDDGVVDLVLDLGLQSTCQPSPCGRPLPG